MAEPTVVVQLSEAEFDTLMKPVRGRGGFQNLINDLHDRTNQKTRRVKLSTEDLIRVHRYATKTGQGGFQDRLNPFVMAMNKLTDVWVKIFAEQ